MLIRIKKHSMLKVILTILTVFLFQIGYSQNKFVGQKAPAIYGISEKGDTIASVSYESHKAVLLNFTATFCGPCWSTYTPMNDLQKKYEDELQIIVIHLDSNKSKWYKLAEKYNVKSDLVSIWSSEITKKIFDEYQVDGFPFFYLINKEGIVCEKWFGNNEKKLRRKVEKEMKNTLNVRYK
jgi:peroxiredoxin